MASFSYLLGFLTICGVCALSLAFLDQEDELIATREKAHYHFQELQKSMEIISPTQKRSTRAKRDAHLNPDIRKSDFLFESLLDFCLEIQNFNGEARNVTSEDGNTMTTEPTVPQFNDTDDADWKVPEVRPIGVTASRDGDRADFRFYLKHSAQARIIRFAGVEYEQTDIEFDESSPDGAMISSVSFGVSKLYSYCIDEKDSYENQFIFEKKDDVATQVTLKIDVCKFDQYQNESSDYYSRNWMTKPGPIHENVISSKILITSDNKDDFVVESGRNESLEVMAEMDKRGYLYFYAIFYDRSKKEMKTNTYTYSVGYRGTPDPDENEKRPWRFLHVEEVDISPTVLPPNYEGRVNVKLRVTLATESGRITGKLYISLMDHFGDRYNPAVVREVTTSLRYLIKKPNRPQVFPRRKILMEEERRFICSERGNERHERFGRNCMLTCWASGRDLETLKITKNGSEVIGYQSMRYVVDDRIFARIDLGPTSADQDGIYECTVADKRSFTKTQKMELFTFGFPKIDGNKSRVEDLGNGLSSIVCYVSGVLPINVSVKIDQDSSFSKSFNESAWSVNETVTEFGKVVQVTLPTNDVRYPAYSAGCQASSDRGQDYQSLDLDDVKNHTLTKARILQDESGIVSYYDNLTTVITCAASGRQPLDVWVAFGGKTNRIDNVTDYTTEEYRTEDSTTVTLTGDTKEMMQATYFVYCEARNEYDTDYAQFYLWNSVDTRLVAN